MDNLNYIDFKDLLYKNKILLYDAELRIAHCRFNNLLNNIKSKDNFINKLLSKPNLLSTLIYSLVNNDTNKINYIINNI